MTKPRYIAHILKDYRGRTRIHYKGQNEAAEKLIVHKILEAAGGTVEGSLTSFNEYHEGEVVDTVWHFVETGK